LIIDVAGKLVARGLSAILAITVVLPLAAGCRDTPANEVNSIADVVGKVIGTLGGTPSERLADAYGQALAFEAGDEMMAFLRAGALDCVIMESSAALELVEQSTGVRILNEPLIEYELRFAIAKENGELLVAVNSALETLRQNGTLSGLSGKYFAGKSYTYVAPEGVQIHPGELLIAVPPDSPPFSFKNAGGELWGFDIEIACAVCDALGVEIQVIEYDAWELIDAVWSGSVDLALGWLPSEGEELVSMSDPYAHAVHVVIVRR